MLTYLADCLSLLHRWLCYFHTIASAVVDYKPGLAKFWGLCVCTVLMNPEFNKKKHPSLLNHERKICFEYALILNKSMHVL